jgi:hypothetical protein
MANPIVAADCNMKWRYWQAYDDIEEIAHALPSAAWCPLSEVRAPSPQHLFVDFGKLWAPAKL